MDAREKEIRECIGHADVVAVTKNYVELLLSIIDANRAEIAELRKELSAARDGLCKSCTYGPADNCALRLYGLGCVVKKSAVIECTGYCGSKIKEAK